MKQLASLQPDGRISSSIGGQQLTFESPSAFRCVRSEVRGPARRAIGACEALPRQRCLACCLEFSMCLSRWPPPSLPCSIYLKRLLNPTRKADDGWKTGACRCPRGAG